MNGDEFLDKISLIKSEFIEEAETAKRLTKEQLFKVLLPFAACIAFVICFGVLMHPGGTLPGELPGENSQNESSESQSGPVTSGPDDYEYIVPNIVTGLSKERQEKFYNPDLQITGDGNSAIVWPWELRTVFEKYDGLDFNGTEYSSHYNEIGEELIGESLGVFEIFGYDEIKDERHFASFEVFAIKKLNPSVAVAVNFGGQHYVYEPSSYDPPKTLGEFIEKYNLTEYLPLNSFSEWKGYEHQGDCGLADYSYIWEVLQSCGESEFIEIEDFDRGEKEYISFSANSEALGINNMAFYVTKDGYIRTNAFRYAYTFFIGEETTDKIIAYALENKTEPPAEPEIEVIYGTVTEIGGNYFVLSDEIMCKNPADSMTFHVQMNDLRISRHFSDYGGLGVGSTVRVNFTGGVDLAKQNRLEDVTDVDYIYISEEGFYEEEETNPA